MEFHIHPDGSLDIQSGSIQITGSYPSIDGISIRPLRIETTPASVRFILDNAELTLDIQQNEQDIIISGYTTELSRAHDISLISATALTGCTRAFRQGLGMGGPSGMVMIDREADIESDALIVVGNDSECLSLHMRNQKRYRCHFMLQNLHLVSLVDVEETADGTVKMPALIIRSGSDFSSALCTCASDIAACMDARLVSAPAFHWCSWYYLYHTLDQQTLDDYLQQFKLLKERAPFLHIQVDAGYFPSCGDWLEPCARFPQGLEGAARSITDAGYEPGIWIGPFMVGDESALYKEHPDWMLRYNNGDFVRPWAFYNEPKTWGYRDNDYYVLDTSHPDAMAYLATVFATLRKFGYTLFKTDFLFWGLQDSTKVRRYTPGKTSVEYFRDVMRMIRYEIGEDAAWLGCISPFMPALGYVDMMRIAGDVGAQWDETGFGPSNMIREVVADHYFNNIYWQNDPDVVMLRDFHIHLNPQQIEALALLQAMSGGVITTSAPIHSIGADRLALLEFIRPEKLAEPVYPFWQENREHIVIVNKLEQGYTILIFNPAYHSVTECYDWKALLGKGSWHLHRMHGCTTPAETVSAVTVEPKSAVLFFASHTPLENEPENLWVW